MRAVPRNAREIHAGNAGAEDYPLKELTEKVIGCAIRVHRELGPGFLEAIYENALVYELRRAGLSCQRQRTVKVLYDGFEVGEHRIDIVVEGSVLVELKSVELLTPKHVAQVISTLKAAKLAVGLLLNFDEARMIERGQACCPYEPIGPSVASASLRPKERTHGCPRPER